MIHSSRLVLRCSSLTLGLLIAASAFGLVSVRAQRLHFSNEERHIIELEDRRAPVDSLTTYLGATEERSAWRAAIALANLGDIAARTSLVDHLKSETRAHVRDGIAYALGVLGPDSAATGELGVLLDAATHAPNSRIIYEAIGRAAPGTQLPVVVKFLSKNLEHQAIQPRLAVETLLRLTLRKVTSELSLALVDQCAMSDDAETRWRAAYCYARTDDSSRLTTRLPQLQTLLTDQGSYLIRMFAVGALGRIHNDQAEALLVKTLRSEEDWHVRVFAIQAISRLPQLDSTLLATLEPIVERSVATDKVSEHTALAALQTIETGLAIGKVTQHADSVALREWLHGFAARFEKYPEMSMLVKSATMPSMVRLGAEDLFDELGDFNGSNEPMVRMNGTRAVESMNDTAIFRQLLETMSLVSDYDQFIRLEALDSLWVHAKGNAVFMRNIEAAHFANLYRYLVIRISDLVESMPVQALALSMIEDSSVVIDSTFHNETETYLIKYLRKFRMEGHHDQLIASIDLARWLHDARPEVARELRAVYDAAVQNGWQDVSDSTISAMRALGLPTDALPKFVPKYEPIDWGLIESASDTLIINLSGNMSGGQIYIRMFRDDAPLTCINMLKLSTIGYFAKSIVHRVVPAFVVQSGDPTMTGWAGPGYAIRTEISPKEYDTTGIAGMASSGKDAEGSQWFITHVPTPHLDARYTAWGIVVKGQNLVDQIQLGAKIENIVPLKR